LKTKPHKVFYFDLFIPNWRGGLWRTRLWTGNRRAVRTKRDSKCSTVTAFRLDSRAFGSGISYAIDTFF